MLAVHAHVSNCISGDPTNPPARKLSSWQDLDKRKFKRELDALWDCNTDGGLLEYVGGGKRPKVPYHHGREYAPTETVNILEDAKLIKYHREERYPDGACVVVYQISAKGKRWLEQVREVKIERQKAKQRKQMGKSTDPDIQRIYKNIQLAEMVERLPPDVQETVKIILEILGLVKRWPWVENSVTPEQATSGKTVTGVMVLAALENQPESVRNIAIEALKDYFAGKPATDAS